MQFSMRSRSPASHLRRWWVSPCLSLLLRRVIIASQVCGVSFWTGFVVASRVPTGYYGTLGNKGGVAIHFLIDESPVLLICSHLSAHKQYESLRNQEFHKFALFD